MTSRPIEAAPPQVEARSGELPAIAVDLERRGHRKIGVEGGGQLFSAGTPELPLDPVKCEPRSGGALHVVYRRRSR